MNISKREKYLLIGVLAVLVGVLYYSFGYTKQVETLEAAKADKEAAITEYNKVQAELATLEERKLNIKDLTASATNKSAKFYPEIIQEKIIIELNEMMEKTGFKGDIAFVPTVVAGVEDSTPNPELIGDTTFQSSVDILKGKSDSIVESSDKTETDDSATTSTEVKTTESTAEKIVVTINYKSSYKQLKDFLIELESYSRKIISPSLIAQSLEGNISGELTLEFYGLPKVDDSDDNYLEWTLKNIYGKDELFNNGNATGAYANSVEEIKANEDSCDFIGMVKSSSSIYPTLQFGKANDSLGKTYIYATSESVVEATLTLTKGDNGKYYYKYSTGASRYPNTNTGNGEEFTFAGDVIKVKIESEARSGKNDKAGVKLKVINNTDKSVEVAINGDDATNPRVELTHEGGSVYKK